MTLCEKHIRTLIEKKKIINIAEFMETALYHPEFGYYMQRQPLGSGADFITAPEVSRLFGETLCFWALEHYHRLSQPQKIAVVELGPGRGLLMADFLHTAQFSPNFFSALEIHSLEISPVLQSLQQRAITFSQAHWHSEIDALLSAIQSVPTLIIANEFFDALPLHQFQKTLHGWYERGVTISPHNHLAFDAQSVKTRDIPFPSAVPDTIFEYCPVAEHIMEKLVRHLDQASGAALILDYGYLDGYGDTLQATSKHHYVPVLENAGAVDITAHVNFGALKKIAGEKSTIMTQAAFLMKHGIVKLAQTHAQKAFETEKNQLAQQLYKLTSSQEMGILFKALEIERFPHAESL